MTEKGSFWNDVGDLLKVSTIGFTVGFFILGPLVEAIRSSKARRYGPGDVIPFPTDYMPEED